jgi:hypothetical protein
MGGGVLYLLRVRAGRPTINCSIGRMGQATTHRSMTRAAGAAAQMVRYSANRAGTAAPVSFPRQELASATPPASWNAPFLQFLDTLEEAKGAPRASSA